MEKIENIIGYFGQMTWPLAKKTAIYCLVAACLAFLKGAYPLLPIEDIINSTKEMWVAALYGGINEVWAQIYYVFMPLYISVGNPTKK